MTITNISNDYQLQIDNRLRELEFQYNQPFSSVFDSSVGSFVLVSNDSQYRFLFQPQTNSISYYPPYTPPQNIPGDFPSAADGNGILRIEHLGLPSGYFPVTIIEGAIGTDWGSRINTNNLTTDSGRISSTYNAVYPNQNIIQLELPMGGPDEIGYHINVSSVVGTPYGSFYGSRPWEGTAGGGQLVHNPQPGLGHTVKINWLPLDVAAPVIPATIVPPAVLPTPTEIKIDTYSIIESILAPSFVPSTLPRSAAQQPLPNPYVSLIQPITVPENAFKSEYVREMYSYSPTVVNYDWTYEVGRTPSMKPVQYKFVNNTINATLRFHFEFPGWISSDTARAIDIMPNQELVVNLQFNESYAKDLSILSDKRVSDILRWFVTPINITGPVYVLRSKTPITTHNVPTQQLPESDLINDVGVNALRIFAEITPPRVSLIKGETFPIKLSIRVGPTNETLNIDNSKLLQFPSNGVVWKSLNPSIANITSPNGSTNAFVEALGSGIADFTAEVILPPTNMSISTWNSIYKNGLSGVNIIQTQLTDFGGVRVYASALIVTSKLQLR